MPACRTQRDIACMSLPHVLRQVRDLDAAVAARPLVAQVAAAVVAAVIHQDNLKVAVSLDNDAADAPLEVWRYVKHGHDDRHQRVFAQW